MILGIDPGYRYTGLALLEPNGPGRYGLVSSKTLKAPKDLEPNERIRWIALHTYAFAVAAGAHDGRLTGIGIEAQENVSIGKIRTRKTNANSLRTRDVAHRIAGMLEGIGTVTVTWVEPTFSKKSVTGRAFASKRAVEQAVSAMSGVVLTAHEADAAAHAIASERVRHARQLLGKLEAKRA
jgi:Holliday junction resolvasome RuvABC endonuclease subunit